MNGACTPCGECKKCEGGACVPCGSDEVCIGGVCVPKQYYCCWDSCADKVMNNNNSTCKAATVSGGNQTDPCGEDNTTGGCGSLKKSGPHATSQLCSQECQRYKCAPDSCGNNQCVPDASGSYASKSACLAGCSDSCSSPCTFAGAQVSGSGGATGTASYVYAIDGCERSICVKYSSLSSRPIRVQIWGPNMVNGCPEPGSRVIKSDSGWRGEECCDCPSARPAGALQGGPSGQITWTKPRGAQSFEVYVFFPCANGSQYELNINCDSPCGDPQGPVKCACGPDVTPSNCNGENCQCCARCITPCASGACGWPAAGRLEFVDCNLSTCCVYPPCHPQAGQGGILDGPMRRAQSFQNGLPGFMAWKTGYPAALASCNWKVVEDYSLGSCLLADELHSDPSCKYQCAQPEKYRYRVMVLSCENGAPKFTDVTSDATTGSNEIVIGDTYVDLEADPPVERPRCAGQPYFPPFFSNPEPVCDP